MMSIPTTQVAIVPADVTWLNLVNNKLCALISTPHPQSEAKSRELERYFDGYREFMEKSRPSPPPSEPDQLFSDPDTYIHNDTRDIRKEQHLRCRRHGIVSLSENKEWCKLICINAQERALHPIPKPFTHLRLF